MKEVLRAETPAGMDHTEGSPFLFLPKIFPVLSLTGHKGSVNFPSNQQIGGCKKKLSATPPRRWKIPSPSHRKRQEHRAGKGTSTSLGIRTSAFVCPAWPRWNTREQKFTHTQKNNKDWQSERPGSKFQWHYLCDFGCNFLDLLFICKMKWREPPHST